MVSGLIPARAGNTVPAVRFKLTGPGSSPLARGTPEFILGKTVSAGLIPARAGNTIRTSLSRTCSRAHPRSRGEHGNELVGGVPNRAHPRSRGEHRMAFSYSQVNTGSSPLARGTRLPESRRNMLNGLIPARAGNTSIRRRAKSPPWAHPRSRGEHQDSSLARAAVTGSSPLARGTPVCGLCREPGSGLIPARAGNTVPVHE